MNVPGYRLGQELGGGPLFCLRRARRERDGEAVLMKSVRPEATPPARARLEARLRREFDLTRSLDLPSVARAVDLVEADGPVLLLEDRGKTPLDCLLSTTSLELPALLAIAVSLSEALSDLHGQGLVHRDIQPSNLLVDLEAGTGQLTGLGLASRVPRHVQGIREPRTADGPFSYISPEQTGRTNRLVDYRTDFYSLGVTLFEMATGRLPFEAADPLELIHAHVAKQPPSPSAVAPRVPSSLSRIILKLIAKPAEARYQSGLGLRADLERCLSDLSAPGEASPFELGAQDAPPRFELPQRLYGRGEEMERLEFALGAAARGEAPLVLVSGGPGVGKTALVQALRRKVVLHRGLFMTGSYDVRRQGTPYSAILDALRGLVRRLLAEAPDRLEAFRRQLTEALGPNLAVVAEVVPELEALTGSAQPVAPLEPLEARHRFHLSIQRLLGVFAAAARPLVLFLDDLQWIDPASLELVDAALEKRVGGLLLVGAYREDDVDGGHPVAGVLARMEEGGARVEHLRVRPLGPRGIEQLVADTLRAEAGQTAPLADLVFRHTAGNPLLARALLSSLYDEGLLRFHARTGWSWDLSRIEERAASEDAGELTARRIAQLPDEVRRTVAFAAALGRSFEAETLAAVTDASLADVRSRLVAACRERVLLKHEDGFHFEHERLREAAYSLIPEADRPRTHLRIGRLLAEREAREPSGSWVFDVVGHFNRALPLLREPGERDRLARLNLSAGRRALASAAFPAAFGYFSEGVALLAERSWEEDYELSLALHCEAAEAALLCGEFAEVDRLVARVHENAKAVLDEIPAWETQISTAHVQMREADALAISVEVLKLLGINIPGSPSQADVDSAVRRVQALLEEGPLADRAADLPPMTDPSSLAAMRILVRAIHTAGWTNYPLLHVMACTATELTIRLGHSPESPTGYLLTGILLCHVLHDFEGGYRLGSLGLALSRTPESARWRLLCEHIFRDVISSWRVPHRSLLSRRFEAFQAALEAGDRVTALLDAHSHCETGLYTGVELPELRGWVLRYRESLSAAGAEGVTGGLERLDALLLGLMAVPADAGRPSAGSPLGEAEWLAWEESVDPVVLQVIYCHEMLIRYLYREKEEALRVALQVEPHPVGRLNAIIPVHALLCLCLLEALPGLSPRERQQHLKRIEAHHELVRLQAQACPTNYEHRLHLVDAQKHRLAGEKDRAIGSLEKALAGARANGYVHEEALADELLAELLLELDSPRLAALHLKEAAAAYARWGAFHKVSELRRTYPEVFASEALAAPAPVSPSGTDPAPDPTADALDVASLERAARTLASELDLGRLLRGLLHLLLQAAGAQRGLLLRAGNEGMFVEAAGSVDVEEIEVPGRAPLDSRDDLCHGIVRYVRRSLETVVLADALADDRFAGDPYLDGEKPKSILCSPMSHQGKPVGILYLENNRIRNAFDNARLTAVQLISSQAAAALENARLHDRLKREVEVRQRAEDELREALQQLAALKDRLSAENVYLREEIQGAHDFEEIVGESAALKSALRKVDLVAATDAAVLILGETGTGKELIARAIHARSARKDAPLVKLNCAALPATLIESELFGYEKGAFTGAHAKRAGRFELADGGTIFLDEIGDLPFELQAKLLRVLQEGEFERLGSAQTLKVDVRIIAATNRDIQHAAANGSFRSDLYYRLSVFPVRLPPLRTRREDIPLLVWSFIAKKQKALGRSIEKVPAPAMEAFLAYDWPGNVRELENVVERCLILSPGTTLTLDDSFGAAAPHPGEPTEQPPQSMEEMERAHILRVLESCGWMIKGKGNAADRLGLHPSTLHWRMKKLAIERPRR
ncbi:MAG: sigma 54-interacting transcriptional regulator [Deltaproteobacteria bacterium]|nr:sigma 54-interacting transcriptional regulator [Deltaproteobacteria bacterium]